VSPKTYSISDGAHTFRVRAVDPFRQIDLTPESRSFTLDTSKPDTNIDSGPDGTTEATSASFDFSSDEASATFECRLDAGTYESCSSGVTYSNLTPGSHTFRVRATDGAGNVDFSPAQSGWTIVTGGGDTTPPETSITDGPGDGATTVNPNPGFSFASNESGSTFECAVDGAQFQSCTSPFVAEGLTDGSHYFAVRATDGSGHTDLTSAVVHFRVDAPTCRGERATLVIEMDGSLGGTAGDDVMVATEPATRS
jgi:hypothetical protein